MKVLILISSSAIEFEMMTTEIQATLEVILRTKITETRILEEKTKTTETMTVPRYYAHWKLAKLIQGVPK